MSAWFVLQSQAISFAAGLAMIATIRQPSSNFANRYADAPFVSTLSSVRYLVKCAVSSAAPSLRTQISAASVSDRS